MKLGPKKPVGNIGMSMVKEEGGDGKKEEVASHQSSAIAPRKPQEPKKSIVDDFDDLL